MMKLILSNYENYSQSVVVLKLSNTSKERGSELCNDPGIWTLCNVWMQKSKGGGFQKSLAN